ncbi:MAG: aspartate carbamoyltransferase catalytic subunit [Thermodesulfovibrionales bacterium]
MSLQAKDLLSMKDLTPGEIGLILDTAAGFKDVLGRDIKKVPALRGKTAVNLFYEPSTRTRTSFEVAAKRLSTDVINIATATSSVVKGETLLDTAKTVLALGADIIVIRHSCSGTPHFLARNVDASVVNAGDGTNEHPTQALLDLFTMQEHKKKFSGLEVAIVGDILHSRVAKSNIYALSKLGAKVRLIGPPTLVPECLKELGVTVTPDMNAGLEGADVIMMLRIQLERQGRGFFPSTQEYFRNWGLTADRVKRAKEDAIIMHPGPMNRGIEISSEVADSSRSVILDQVTNGIAVRMAVLYLLSGVKQ